MVVQTVFTFGYSGRKVEQLIEVAERLKAAVIDCRFSPFSRDKNWNIYNLQRRIGSRYVWFQEFGNVLYKTMKIQLNEPEQGLVRLKPILDQQSVILVCMCPIPAECHRQTVAELIRDRFGNPIKWLVAKDLKDAPMPRKVQEEMF